MYSFQIVFLMGFSFLRGSRQYSQPFQQNLLIYLRIAEISIFEAHIWVPKIQLYLLKLYLDISWCIVQPTIYHVLFTHVLQLTKLYTIVPSTQHIQIFLARLLHVFVWMSKNSTMFERHLLIHSKLSQTYSNWITSFH